MLQINILEQSGFTIPTRWRKKTRHHRKHKSRGGSSEHVIKLPRVFHDSFHLLVGNKNIFQIAEEVNKFSPNDKRAFAFLRKSHTQALPLEFQGGGDVNCRDRKANSWRILTGHKRTFEEKVEVFNKYLIDSDYILKVLPVS